MTITINTRNAAAGLRYFSSITPLHAAPADYAGKRGEIRFPYNPTKYKIRTVAGWAALKIPGSERDGAKWIQNPPRVIAFEMIISNAMFTPSGSNFIVPGRLQQFITDLERYASDPTTPTQAPTWLLLTLGSFKANVVLRTLDASIDTTDASGDAQTATLGFEFWEVA